MQGVATFEASKEKRHLEWNYESEFRVLYYCMRNFCNLIGLEQ